MLGSRPLSRTTAFAPRRDLKPEKPFHQERPALFVASPNHNPKLPILSISYLSRFPVPPAFRPRALPPQVARLVPGAVIKDDIRRLDAGKTTDVPVVRFCCHGDAGPGGRRRCWRRLPVVNLNRLLPSLRPLHVDDQVRHGVSSPLDK